MSRSKHILNKIKTSGHFMDFFKYDPFKTPFDNFLKLVAMQEGGLSNWQNDSASAYFPPEVWNKNGKRYHTNRGFIWPTFQSQAGKYGLPNGPQDFYNMTAKQSDIIKSKWFYNEFQYTDNEVINVFCFYISWGGGWSNGRFNKHYEELTGKNCIESFKSKNWDLILKNMAQARINDLMVIAAKPNYRNTAVPFLWRGAIQIFYREFSPNVKKK